MHKRTLVALFALLGLIAAACGGDDDDGGDGGGGAASGDGGATQTLVVGTDAEPTTLDIQIIDDNGLHLATWSINEGLVDFGPEGEIEPILATELPVMDEDEPTRWHVTLREGITFTDGEPFNAEAVVYNVERIVDEEFGSVLAEELGGLSGAEAVDEYSVDLITEEPDPLLINRLRKLRIVSPAAAEEADYAENPVGTGPYVFDEWQRGQQLTLSANEDYWGEPKPEIDEIQIRFIPDANTRMAALEAGEISIAVNPPDSRIPEIEQNEELQVLFVPGGEAGTTRFNTSVAPYSDVRFRQALNYALDKETMVEQLFNGLYPVQDCNIAPEGVAGHNPDLEAYPYDPDRARELLAEVDIPDGFVIDFQGSSNVYGSDREVQETMASYWRDVGLEVDVTFHEIDPYLEAIYNPDLPIVYAESDHALNSLIRQIGTFLERGGPVTALDEETQSRLDPLVETVKGTLDEEERDETMREIAQIACDEALFVFTFFREDVTAMTADIEYVSDLGQFEKVDWHRMTIGEGG